MTGRMSEETDGGNLGACLPFPAVLPGPQTGPWPTTMTAVISEPSPAPGARELFPDLLADMTSGTFLCFLFFVLEAPG